MWTRRSQQKLVEISILIRNTKLRSGWSLYQVNYCHTQCSQFTLIRASEREKFSFFFVFQHYFTPLKTHLNAIENRYRIRMWNWKRNASKFPIKFLFDLIRHKIYFHLFHSDVRRRGEKKKKKWRKSRGILNNTRFTFTFVMSS